MLSDPSIYLLLISILNQRSNLLFLDGSQCCCDITNGTIRNLVKLRSLAWGDISRESCRYSIQDSVVIIAHGGDTVLNRTGKTLWGGFNEDYFIKGPAECPSRCWWRERGLYVDMGEAVGQEGALQWWQPLKMGWEVSLTSYAVALLMIA